MKKRRYTDDFKLKLVEEYENGDLGIADFTSKNKISMSTFGKWLEKYRKHGEIKSKREISENIKPIDITKEAKEIMKESITHEEQKISLEINGITLTFPLKNLKIFLEAIQNGWSW